METRTLAFEIGTEEIPAFALADATQKLGSLAALALDDARIPHGDIDVYTTPRRLAFVAHDVAEGTEPLDEVFKGPSAKIAFDEDGSPTKAAIGFAKGKGLSAEQLEVREEDGVEYVFASISKPSEGVMGILPECLRGIIDALSWPKSMKWASHRELFTRPVRWLCALFGDEVVKLEYAGLESGRLTMGHRVLCKDPVEVPRADSYVDTVRAAFVIPTEGERRQSIEDGVRAAEKKTGYLATLPAKTLAEVVNLCEYPTVLVGQFDAKFLKVPEEIIVDAMLMHQRYFPLYSDGKLTNSFIVVSNGNPECSETILDGNERVVAARLYDAKFFYEEDLKLPLESYVDRLSELVFQEKLGSMLDKTERVRQLASKLCMKGAFEAAVAEDVERCARLSKADLATNAVIEFTSVQGIMGSYYAKASGESDEVAQGIAEHYMPRFSGDDIPSSEVGQMVALSDKIDSICGLFAIGQAPTGSKDPFALRRAALGVISILLGGLSCTLKDALDASFSIYEESGLEFNRAEVEREVEDFFVTRCKVQLKDEGNSSEAIDAIVATGIIEPCALFERTAALTAAMKDEPDVFEDLSIAYGRANNLRDASLGTDVDASLFDASESRLSEAMENARTEVSEAMDSGDFSKALDGLASLRSPIDAFFEETMVMDEDERIRDNRLRLLNRFVDVFSGVADFSKIARKKLQ